MSQAKRQAEDTWKQKAERGVIGRADLLNLHVASVEDGDAQLEGAGHHGAETTWDTHTHIRSCKSLHCD